jgi:hypothetical protein
MIPLNSVIELTLSNNTTIKLDNLEVMFHDDNTNQIVFATIKQIPGSIILWKDTEYQNIGEWTQKQAEDKLMETLGEDIQLKLRNMFPKTLEDHPYGPGTMLSQMLSNIGIASSPTCKCKQRAIEMNEKGNDWCDQNTNTILEWMKEESIKRGIPFVKTAAQLMVNRAISKSRKLLAEINK